MPFSAQSSGSAWLAVRRPLALAAFLGCAISLMASGTVTLRLVFPAAIYWSFVPLVQMAGLALAMRKRTGAAAIDAYFASFNPWLLWLAAFAAMWAVAPAHAAYGSWQFPRLWWALAAVAAAWALWIDFGFFRRMQYSRGAAVSNLAIQRFVSWSIGMTIFVAPAGWQAVAARLGL
jgi:hypothetical protein